MTVADRGHQVGDAGPHALAVDMLLRGRPAEGGLHPDVVANQGHLATAAPGPGLAVGGDGPDRDPFLS